MLTNDQAYSPGTTRIHGLRCVRILWRLAGWLLCHHYPLMRMLREHEGINENIEHEDGIWAEVAEAATNGHQAFTGQLFYGLFIFDYDMILGLAILFAAQRLLSNGFA